MSHDISKISNLLRVFLTCSAGLEVRGCLTFMFMLSVSHLKHTVCIFEAYESTTNAFLSS